MSLYILFISTYFCTEVMHRKYFISRYEYIIYNTLFNDIYIFGKDYPKTLTTKEEKYQHETELTLI